MPELIHQGDPKASTDADNNQAGHPMLTFETGAAFPLPDATDHHSRTTMPGRTLAIVRSATAATRPQGRAA